MPCLSCTVILHNRHQNYYAINNRNNKTDFIRLSKIQIEMDNILITECHINIHQLSHIQKGIQILVKLNYVIIYFD